MELESDSNYDTIEKVENAFSKINIPIENNNFFIKKAENELSKKLSGI